MTGLRDAAGARKYLTAEERTRFLAAADAAPREVRALCHTLAWWEHARSWNMIRPPLR